MKKFILLFLLVIMGSLFAELEIDIPFENPVLGPPYEGVSYTFTSEHFEVTNLGVTEMFNLSVEPVDLPDGWNLMWCHELEGSGNCHISPSWDFEFPNGSILDLDFIMQNVSSLDDCTITYTFTSTTLTEPIVIEFTFYPENFVSASDEYTVESAKNVLSNYPNPFNPSTTISFELTPLERQSAVINIFNVKGQIVKTFDQLSGNSITWNGTDDNAKNVNSGIYYYQLLTSNSSEIRKLVLLK